MNNKRVSFTTLLAVIGFSIFFLAKTPMLPVSEAESVAVAASDNTPSFVGTWTAQIDGTRIIELVLRPEKGSLTGVIRVAGFSIDTEGTENSAWSQTKRYPLIFRFETSKFRINQFSSTGQIPTATKIIGNSNEPAPMLVVSFG